MVDVVVDVEADFEVEVEVDTDTEGEGDVEWSDAVDVGIDVVPDDLAAAADVQAVSPLAATAAIAMATALR